MANPGFGPLDGSAPTAFLTFPDTPSTDPRIPADRARYMVEGRDRFGRVAFRFVTAVRRRWRFQWNFITEAEADTLQSRADERHCLFYPDTDNTDLFYHVLILEDRLPIQQVKGDLGTGGLVTTGISFEEV